MKRTDRAGVQPSRRRKALHGIQSRLLIRLALLVGFILVLFWICQIVLLKNYYQAYRNRQVHTAAETILQNIDHEDLDDLTDRLSADRELCVLMKDAEGNTLLSSDHVRFCLIHHMTEKELQRLIERTPADGEELIQLMEVNPFRNEEYHQEEFIGDVPPERGPSGRSMVYSRRVFFDDGTWGTLMINAQITPTRTLTALLRRQFAYIVGLTLAATAVFGYLMARGTSIPLIETNRAAKDLSHGSYVRTAHSDKYREISELNDTLEQAARDLKKVEALQRELIANISHDLRTPLTMIQGYAETMRDIPEEMTPENMQIIIEEAQRLSSLVDHVLEFSKLNARKMPMQIAPFDLEATLKKICQRVCAMTEKDGLLLDCEFGEPQTVLGDEARIEQVVYNLLGNALTYTGEDRRVQVRTEERGDRIRVSISDSGQGIAKEDLPYVWDRYYRSEENHRRALFGSGLGLNICREILKSHGAPYGVDSREGEGTTFWFELEKAG